MFVGGGGFGPAVGIEGRGSGGGWQWLVEHRGRKECMVCKNVVVECGESGSSCQLLALELKSGYLLRLIVSFHGDAVGVGIGGSEKALSNVGRSEIS